VDASVAVRLVTLRANGLQFGVLEAGSGPLALCLHGFPDSADTWRHLLPALARAGFHAVAPFMRGYAPTSVPADGAYHLGAGFAETVVARDDMAYLDKLWRDWSPGFQPDEHLARVKQSLRQPANLAAALGYYRAAGAPGPADQAPQPTLYLHGARDGCIGVDLARGSERFLAPSSRMTVIDDAGHFLHLEKPGQVSEHILSWVS